MAQQAQARGCKTVDGGNITVIEAPRPAPVANRVVTAPPASAPRVEPAEQRARDADARNILEAELRKAFGADTDALIASGAVEIVPTVDKIPGGPHPADVKAATAPDGKVYVVAQNVSPAEARGLLLHLGAGIGLAAGERGRRAPRAGHRRPEQGFGLPEGRAW